MKRYAVFAWDNFYPAGGFDDFRGAYDHQLPAVGRLRQWLSLADEDSAPRAEAGQIVDLQTGRVIYRGYSIRDRATMAYVVRISEVNERV